MFDPIVNGLLTGIVSRMLTAPLDCLKIRYQLQSRKQPTYTHIVKTIKHIMRTEGPKAFWKGNSSALILYASYGAIQWSSYEQLKMATGDSVWVSGGAASFLATAISYPFDVVRSRLVMRPGAAGNIGLISFARSLVQREGLGVFWNGLGVSLLSIVPSMAISFGVHNKIKTLLSDDATRNKCLYPRDMISKDAIAATGAAIISKAVVMPLDVVRRRMQVRPTQDILRMENYKRGLRGCVRGLWKEGIASFWSGLGLALAKSVPLTVCNFVVYGALSRL